MLKISADLALPLDVLTEAMGIVATRGAGKSFTSAVLIEEAFAAGVPVVVLDPAGVYHGLRSNAAGSGPGLAIYVFGGQHGDLPLESHAGAFLADLVVDSGHSFVLDLSDLTRAKARTFVADFLDRLYERKARQKTTLLLVIDEADEFAPQLQRNRGDAPRCLGAVETITKRGRSRGVGVVLITQRTQALNKDVLDLIETLIVMRQLAERSREAVKGWIADKELRDDSGVIESLQSLPTGTAWVWSPLRGILQRIKVRRIRTFDSYATPKPGETIVEPAARAELDLDALGEQMRATVERAKESDPGELRKKIRELERDIAERPAEQVTVDREVKVEVPVVSDADMKRIDDLIARVEAESARLTDSYLVLREVLHPLASNVRDALDQRDILRRPPLPVVSPSERRAISTVKVPPRPRAEPSANGDVSLNRRAERMVLAVLAQYPEGRSKRQTAILAGYASKGGGFNGALSKLRTAGYIVGSDQLQITDAGLAAINGQYEPLPEGRALLEHWLGTLNRAAERAVLQVLYDANGEPVDKQTVADRAGYEVAGGGFNGALSKLRTLELIEGSRELRISETLL